MAAGHPPLCIAEADGSPITWPYKLKVPNGSLTDNGDGTISLAVGITSESDPIVKAINGIVKSNTSTISAAVAGTDYIAPTTTFTQAGQQFIINQTSAVGTEWVSGNPTGLIWINDDRTGTTTNEAAEATVVIDSAAGASAGYGLYVKNSDIALDNAATLWFAPAQSKILEGANQLIMMGRSGHQIRLDPNATNAVFILDTFGTVKPAMLVPINNNFIVCSTVEKDYDHAAQTNPTLFIHSATDPDSNNTQWLSLTHDQTNGVITAGTGSIGISPKLIVDHIGELTGSHTTIFDNSVTIASNVKSMPLHLRATIVDPGTAYGVSTTICLVPKTDAALTITNIEVTLDASANEVAGDVKYADAFIGLANAAVVNDFDTTSGVRSDSSIASGAVAAGKCIYLSFDSEPNAAIKLMNIDITYDYD